MSQNNNSNQPQLNIQSNTRNNNKQVTLKTLDQRLERMENMTNRNNTGLKSLTNKVLTLDRQSISGIAGLDAKVKVYSESVDKNINILDVKCDDLSLKCDDLNGRLINVDKKVDIVNQKVDIITNKLTDVTKTMNNKLTDVTKTMNINQVITEKKLDNHKENFNSIFSQLNDINNKLAIMVDGFQGRNTKFTSNIRVNMQGQQNNINMNGNNTSSDETEEVKHDVPDNTSSVMDSNQSEETKNDVSDNINDLDLNNRNVIITNTNNNQIQQNTNQNNIQINNQNNMQNINQNVNQNVNLNQNQGTTTPIDTSTVSSQYTIQQGRLVYYPQD